MPATIHVRGNDPSTQPVPVATWSDFPSAIKSITTDLIVVTSGESPVDLASIPSDSWDAEVVCVSANDPRGWFWSHAKLPLCAALGLPDGALFVRRSVADRLNQPGVDVDFGTQLLLALAQLDLRIQGPSLPSLAQCSFRSRSTTTGPKSPRRSSGWRKFLLGLRNSECLRKVSDETEATAVRAGLLLLNDLLDDSHNLSQSIEGQGRGNGDYWHAIMHRREPDFGNAKYWFRHVGQHPVMADLPAVATSIATDINSPLVDEWRERITRRGWDAIAAVDLFADIESSNDASPELVAFAERLQWGEMLLLLARSCSDAG